MELFPKQSEFLNLPAELRELIYFYATVKPAGDSIQFWAQGVSKYGQPVVEPALLAVNRQIRAEAMVVFYGQNTFFGMLSGEVEDAISKISDDKLPLFRAIRAFDGWDPELFSPRQLLGFIRDRASLVMKCGRGLVRSEALIVPLPGPNGLFDTTFDRLDEYRFVEDKRGYSYFEMTEEAKEAREEVRLPDRGERFKHGYARIWMMYK